MHTERTYLYDSRADDVRRGKQEEEPGRKGGQVLADGILCGHELIDRLLYLVICKF